MKHFVPIDNIAVVHLVVHRQLFTRSVFNALSVGSDLVAAVGLCIKREGMIIGDTEEVKLGLYKS